MLSADEVLVEVLRLGVVQLEVWEHRELLRELRLEHAPRDGFAAQRCCEQLDLRSGPGFVRLTGGPGLELFRRDPSSQVSSWSSMFTNVFNAQISFETRFETHWTPSKSVPLQLGLRRASKSVFRTR